MDDLEDDSSELIQGENSNSACTDDANAMKNIGMDEVTPEGLTYHVNTIELEVER